MHALIAAAGWSIESPLQCIVVRRLVAPSLIPSACLVQPLKSSAEAVFGAGGGDSKATMPDMGPLGNFLLARWRETTAKERMGQSWQFSN